MAAAALVAVAEPITEPDGDPGGLGADTRRPCARETRAPAGAGQAPEDAAPSDPQQNVPIRKPRGQLGVDQRAKSGKEGAWASELRCRFARERRPPGLDVLVPKESRSRMEVAAPRFLPLTP